jgi:hypothetical protein
MAKSSPNACSGAVKKMEPNHRLSTASLVHSEQFQFFLLEVCPISEILASFWAYSAPLQQEEGLESLAIVTQLGRGI